MKTLRNLTLLFSIITMTVCCNDRKVNKIIATNTAYCEDSAMACFMTEPERAITILDSAVVVGNINQQRAEYLKAIVMYDGFQNPDSCIKMCKRIIENESWSEVNDTDYVVTQVDVYRLIATAASTTGNKQVVIRYAAEGIKLAHGKELFLGDEADLLSRMGYMMFQSGQREEGMEKMREAENLAKSAPSWSALLAYFNNAKKLYECLATAKQYDQGKTTILTALKCLDEVERNPEKVEKIPEALLADSTAFRGFADTYKTSFYAYMTNIYANASSDSAEIWLERFHSTSLSERPINSFSIIHPLVHMGKYDEARRRIAKAKEFFGIDTFNIQYVTLLDEEKEIEKKCGNFAAATSISDRIIDISDSLEAKNYQQALAEYATQYQLQEEKLKREDAERQMLYILIGAIVFVSLVAIAFGMIYIRKILANRKKLEEQITMVQQEINTLKEEQRNKADDKPRGITPEEIFKRAVMIMEKYHPYKDSAFDITMLSQQIFVNKNYVSAAINQISGMNFRSWVAQYRVEAAKQILLTQPTIKGDDLAALCGFDNRITLYRQFKKFEDTTPTEWAEKNENSQTDK